MKKTIMLTVVLSALTAFATDYERAEIGKPPPVPVLKSYRVLDLTLAKPVVKLNIEGVKTTYERAYVIELKIDLPKYAAEPVEIWIGEYQIPEVVETRDGFYGYIYDPALLERLNGQSIFYRFETPDKKKIGTFQLNRDKTFEVIKELDFVMRKE